MMNPLIHVLKDENTTTMLLSCIYKCVKQFDGWQNPSKWNEVDDILNDIMKRIVFEADNRCAAILYLFIAKLTILPMRMPQNVCNQTDFEHIDKILATVEKSSAEEQSQQYEKLRTALGQHHNCLVARWTKKLMEVFTQRALIGSSTEIRFQIHVMSFNIHANFSDLKAFFMFYTQSGYAHMLFVLLVWKSFIHPNEMHRFS